MSSASYQARRDEIETYFDRTAADSWARLTSDAPVSRIRKTVRRGRDAMRSNLLDWLPSDLNGTTILDAGCGTGTLAIEAANRGAEVVALDLSPTLINIARERLKNFERELDVTFLVGDMRDIDLGDFDYAVAMDSLIHYDVEDGVKTLETMARKISKKIVFTFAPWTPLLSLMHTAGRFFPKQDRAPSIEPVSKGRLVQKVGQTDLITDWNVGRCHRVDVGFYKSQALELVHK